VALARLVDASMMTTNASMNAIGFLTKFRPSLLDFIVRLHSQPFAYDAHQVRQRCLTRMSCAPSKPVSARTSLDHSLARAGNGQAVRHVSATIQQTRLEPGLSPRNFHWTQ
jgi:hypothetical protein